MAYTTEANIRILTGMNDDTLITDAYIENKIAYADNVIDSKIGQVYQLPLSSTPKLIELLSCEIAIGLIYLDQFGEESADKDKGGQKRIDNAMKILEDIQDLKSRLYDSAGVEYPRSSFMSPSFYPTEASSDPEAENSTAPQITRNRVF